MRSTLDTYEKEARRRLSQKAEPWQYKQVIDGECEGMWIVFRDLADDESMLYDDRRVARMACYLANEKAATAVGVDEWFDLRGQHLGDCHGPKKIVDMDELDVTGYRYQDAADMAGEDIGE